MYHLHHDWYIELVWWGSEVNWHDEALLIWKHNTVGCFYTWSSNHHNDVIMSTMVSQITSLMSVCSTVYSGADQKKNIKAPCHWALCGEFTGDRWIPTQMASNAENVSIWWRHHVMVLYTLAEHKSGFDGELWGVCCKHFGESCCYKGTTLCIYICVCTCVCLLIAKLHYLIWVPLRFQRHYILVIWNWLNIAIIIIGTYPCYSCI